MKRKIALICNMNNNFSALCRYLRDKGYDASLLILKNEPPHFHPKADCYDDWWRSGCEEVQWGNIYEDKLSSLRKTISESLSSYDLLIGCGHAPAFVSLVGRTLDVFVPYGSDLYSFPFYRFVNPSRQLRCFYFTHLQRTGIVNAKKVCMAPTGGILERCLAKLKVHNDRVVFTGVPMVYAPQYTTVEFFRFGSQSDLVKGIQDAKKDGAFTAIHPSRHSWRNAQDNPSKKGNDLFFRGISMLRRSYSNLKLKVFTFEYGVDVAASKELVRDLGIEDIVEWFPVVDRNLLTRAMFEIDVVVGELFHPYFSYGVVYEALALSKPLLHNRGNISNPLYENPYPMLQASSAIEVKRAIKRLIDSPELRHRLACETKDWFEKNLVERAFELTFDF